MSDVFDQIARRFTFLNPKIHLKDHIGGNLKVFPDTLQGIRFVTKDTGALLAALDQARDSSGGQAFVRSRIKNKDHWAVALSFGATEGVGFRQVWRFPPLGDRKWERPLLSDRYAEREMRAFDARFGDSLTLPDMTSLHLAVEGPLCAIHIDEAGFVVEGADGNVSLNMQLTLHFLDELLLKTILRELIPGKVKPLYDRLSLIYPNLRNDGYAGPRVSKTPLLRELGNARFVGPVLGRLPLPNGLSFDLWRTDKLRFKVQGTLGPNGERSAALTFGGVMDVNDVAERVLKYLGRE